MFGQLCEPEPLGPGARAGVVLEPVVVLAGAVVAGVVVVAVVELELAALAIAAPPPTTAPVTATTVTMRFNRAILHLLSVRFRHDAGQRSERCRTQLRVVE
jgi:hypothetical protein